MTPAVLYPSIDQRLGPAEDRFFGTRHRETDLLINNMEIAALTVRATARLRYPAIWSRKAAGNPAAHLSSIDALAIMTELGEAYLTHTLSLDAGERSRCWLRSFKMRVGAPTEELDEFAVSADLSPKSPASDDGRTWRSMFDCRMGTIGGTCVIEHERGTRRADRGLYSTSADLLGDPRDRHHGDRYKQRRQAVEDVRVDVGRMQVDAAVSVSEAPGAGPERGLAAAYQPTLSMIDAVVSLAQMAQVLTYELDGLERDHSHTFWMRRLAMQRDSPRHPLDARMPASIAVENTRLPRLDGNVWRTLDVTGGIAGIAVQAAVAHQLPAGIAGATPTR